MTEVLVATLIFAIVALAASAATLASIRSAAVSKNHTVATALAEDRLEKMRADHQAGAALASGSSPSGCASASGTFCTAWTIPDPDVTGAPGGMISVRVRVSWTDLRPEAVTLHTLIDG